MRTSRQRWAFLKDGSRDPVRGRNRANRGPVNVDDEFDNFFKKDGLDLELPTYSGGNIVSRLRELKDRSLS